MEAYNEFFSKEEAMQFMTDALYEDFIENNELDIERMIEDHEAEVSYMMNCRDGVAI